MATQKYTNLGAGTLTSTYTAGDTTLHLGTGQGALFPTGGDFIVGIDSPPAFYLKCTARSTDDLTVSSTGQEGTTAANKAAGIAVTEVLTAGALSSIRGDMMGYGAAASLPITSEAHKGDQYQCSDAPVKFVYDGSVWQAITPSYPVTLPVLSSFTGVTGMTTATTTDTGAGITVNTTGSSAYYKTGPGSTPFSCTLGYMGVIALEDFATVAILGRESATGKFVIFGMQHAGQTLVKFFANKQNADGSFNASYAARDCNVIGGVVFLRITDDGTNRKFQVSYDGQTFGTFFSALRTDFVTCNQFGWYITSSTNFAPAGRLVHWAQG